MNSYYNDGLTDLGTDGSNIQAYTYICMLYDVQKKYHKKSGEHF